MSRSNRSNNLIKWLVIACDFITLNAVLMTFDSHLPQMQAWTSLKTRTFFILCNLALLISELNFHTIVHERLISAGEILKRIILLTITQTVVAYLLLKAIDYRSPVGHLLMMQGTVFFVVLLIRRLAERSIVKIYRHRGGNSRTVTFVGANPELLAIYEQLVENPTTGYKMTGYYADEVMKGAEIPRLGTLQELMENLNDPEKVNIGDELYVCMSRKERDTIKKLSYFCDQNVKQFFYVPVSVETLSLNLKREYINDIEVFSTYESPLQNPVNKAIKRLEDLVLATLFLIPTFLIFPFVWLIIKIQSPGPIFFRQERTGLDGKTFRIFKFRSMHVNVNADKLQATKDDPRKFPFGNFMRKANIDELPQFLNVILGDMSIVGPRPHMLAHTEMYSQLIDKYMVRHFVKPGVTGWAQVTGYRGETKELWQMEGRVERDMWYIEHWSFWLDVRIIWLTFKSMFVHDKQAY